MQLGILLAVKDKVTVVGMSQDMPQVEGDNLIIKK